jgi:hypothetical protein
MAEIPCGLFVPLFYNWCIGVLAEKEVIPEVYERLRFKIRGALVS